MAMATLTPTVLTHTTGVIRTTSLKEMMTIISSATDMATTATLTLTDLTLTTGETRTTRLREMRTTTSTVAMAMDMVASPHMAMVPTLTPMATHSMDSRTALRRITTLSTTPSTEAGLASLTDILVATLTDTVLTTSTPMVVLQPLLALLRQE